jgi:serine/threonine protein kinase
MTDLQGRLRDALSDRYRVERELGRGGMATVFLAHDLKHHRRVAIKVLHPELAAVLGTERFLREIEIAASLTHPHILPLHDSGQADGLLYYVMPFVDGESLRQRLQQLHQLPIDEALGIARSMLAALGYAHDRGVVHRDIKPENILLSGGEAMVADFGIARAIEVGGGGRMTQTGIAIGTPAYMSPEQAAGEHQLDGRADLYSVACVLYEMLAGRPPFDGPTAQAMLVKRLSTSPPSLRITRESVPLPIDQAVRRALAPDPADRFSTASQFGSALEMPLATASEPVRSRRGWILGGAVALVVALGTIFWLRARSDVSSVSPSASLIAVFPLVPSTPDTTLTRLGRDLAATLSANLDGVAEIRTVDRLTMLAQVNERQVPPSLEEAAALSRKFGALSLVRGTVVRAGDSVRIDLGLYTVDSLRPVAQSVVTGSPNELAALTDSLTWSLLRQVWRTRDPPTPSLAAVTTRSIPALRAFLEGERAILRSSWRPAAEAFARAIEADSSFWLAYWRYAYVRTWSFDPIDSGIVQAYQGHRTLLPEQDRRLIEVAMGDSRSVQFDRLQQVTRDFPDYWPGWMLYADWLVHWMPPLGATNAEAAVALERTVELNPALSPAWDHLAWMAIARRDTLALARCLAALDQPGARASIIEGNGVDLILLYSFVAEELRSGSALAKPVADSLVEMIVASRDPFWQMLLAGLIQDYGLPREQIGISRRVLRAGVAPEVAAWHRRAIAFSWAARGAWDSAMTAIDDYAQHAPGTTGAIESYGLASMGVWLSALDSTAAVLRRPAAIRAAEGSPERVALVRWYDGMLAVARHDRPAVSAVRAALAELADSSAEVFEGSLAGLELELSSDPAGAGPALAALELARAETMTEEPIEHPYLTAVNRLTASRQLLLAGDTTAAARLLAWHQAWVPPLPDGPVTTMLASLGYLEQARIEQARGRKDMAREYYQLFLARYDLPVPRHQHLVTEARRALNQLRIPD